ncbi:MAG: DUF4149 domain-containing protein [Chloroflexi bacterium]|nr:DUF4149 domain-containing protein [Chloroflexota bacterium]
METLYFDVLKVLYLMSMAVIVGGGLVLGAAAAPALFASAKTRGEAGALFGAILARYDVFAVLAVFLVAVTSVLKAGAFETAVTEVIVRWVALAVMAVATLYASLWSNPIARALRAGTRDWDDLPESALARREFAGYHARSRRAMTLAVLAGLVALYLS